MAGCSTARMRWVRSRPCRLDNQRNLKLAIHKDPVFLDAARKVAEEMNAWAREFHGREIIQDWQTQLDFTTKIFRARGLHLDDRHIRDEDGQSFSASIVDLTLYVVNNYQQLQQRWIIASSSICPRSRPPRKRRFGTKCSRPWKTISDLDPGTIKVYVLVEQLEATFQLMEIRAALGKHFVGYNTGRWDYINSVADALAWDPDFINPNIDAITMTYGYMRNYEDRVRRAVNTPDRRRTLRTVARRHGAEHSGRFPGGCRQQHAQSRRRGRARATGRGQRQVGGPLEDGPHRAAGLGKGG